MNPDRLSALRRRDPEALRDVAQEHTRRLYRAARGMGHAETEAEDLVQDVFVTFLTTLDRFEGRSSVGTWLYGIFLRKVQERRRSRVKEDRHDPLDETFASNFSDDGRWVRPPADPVKALEGREASRAIRDCLDDLTEGQRDVFVLRQVEELSAAEVGNVLELTVTHVGVLLHRARLRMRACLDRLGWRTTT